MGGATSSFGNPVADMQVSIPASADVQAAQNLGERLTMLCLSLPDRGKLMSVCSQCPSVLSQCLGVRSQCPAVLSQCPPVFSQCPAVLSQHPSVYRQRLGVPVHRFLNVQHGIGDRGEVVLDARDAARQLQAGHAGQSIADSATPSDTVLAT